MQVENEKNYLPFYRANIPPASGTLSCGISSRQCATKPSPCRVLCANRPTVDSAATGTARRAGTTPWTARARPNPGRLVGVRSGENGCERPVRKKTKIGAHSPMRDGGMNVAREKRLVIASARRHFLRRDDGALPSVCDAGGQPMRAVEDLTVRVERNRFGAQVIPPLADGARHRAETVDEIRRRASGRLPFIEAVARAHHLQVGFLGPANRGCIPRFPCTRQFDLEDEVEAKALPHHVERIDCTHISNHPRKILLSGTFLPPSTS